MALPLLSLVDDAQARARIAEFLLDQETSRDAKRHEATEMQVLYAVVEAFETGAAIVRVADIADRLNARFSEKHHLPLSNKAVGFIVCQKLGIPTTKSHGTYAIGQDKREQVYALADRHGVPHTAPVPQRRLEHLSQSYGLVVERRSGGRLLGLTTVHPVFLHLARRDL